METVVAYNTEAWDADRIQACLCDPGYFGADCSSRQCPTGDDPLTLCESDQKGMVQEIKLTLGSRLLYEPSQGDYTVTDTSGESMDVFGTLGSTGFADIQQSDDGAQLRIGARDAWGQVYYAPTSAKAVLSRTVDGVDAGSDSIEVALESIAGNKVRNVRVTSEFVGAIGRVLQKRYLVTFVPNEQNSANFGIQQTLVCDSGYGCTTPGCAPIVKMPFLYRYASTPEQSSIDTLPVTSTVPTAFSFFAGSASNTQASFEAKNFIRLHADSQPQLPPGVEVDNGVSSSSPDRYDIRVVIAVQHLPYVDDGMTSADVYWTKVVFGNTNITTDTFEYKNNVAGVFNATKASNFVGTLNGFTYRGLIPSGKKATIPDAPGVILEFPDTSLVQEPENYRFFEILIKLPSCQVTPYIAGVSTFLGVGDSAIVPVDNSVENIECSNRGQCNRESGLCECFDGYYGVACHRQTVLV